MKIEFKGFDSWVPIFRGGKQIDSQGREHDGDALIEKAMAKFNAAVHEPSAVIGHPADNAPAYGWVADLKKEGDLLLAKFRQVQPEFASMVGQGLFKKRFAAFYPDGSLRHVGFLGAAPPAVKGLPDVAFTEADAMTFELKMADRGMNDNKNKEDKMTLKQKLIAAFNEFIGKMPDDGLAQTATPPSGQFTEADIQTAKETAAQKEREKVTAEFAEKDKLARQVARKGEIASWCGSIGRGRQDDACNGQVRHP
jgi:hypothetical protein